LFIRNFLRWYREANEITARLQGGDRCSKFKGKEQQLLNIMVREQSDVYLREIQKPIKERAYIEVSISSLSRTLKRLKLKRKKNFSSNFIFIYLYIVLLTQQRL